MSKVIRWRIGVPREINGRGGVKIIDYRCVTCGRSVYDGEKKQLTGVYEKRDIFNTGTMLVCGRCGQSVAIIAEGEG